MNSRNVCVAILSLCLVGFGWSEDLLGNGTFDSPLSTASPNGEGAVDTGRSWIFYLNSGATAQAVIEGGQLVVTPDNIASQPYGIQLIQSPVPLQKGGDYELSFDARSTASRPVTIKIGGTSGRAWTAYSGEQKVTLTEQSKRYVVSFTMNQPDDPAARVEFWFTAAPQPVWLDNVVLKKLGQADVGPAPVRGTKTKADEDLLTKWEMVWSDEFNGPQIDPTKWGFEKGNNGGWGNRELEFYTDKAANASIQKVDGASSLVITARKEKVKEDDQSFDYTSARLLTKYRFSMHQGKLEVRAKLPQGQGIWPAIWLLGTNIDTVSWPACGEIDLMELLGHQPGKVYSTIHGPVTAGPGIGQPFSLPAGKTFSDDFHVFSLEWYSDHLEFLVDGQLFFVADKARIQYEHGKSEWAYDHPYFLILNLAVGGAWPGHPDATTKFPQSMAVDYVRVYKNVGSELGPGEMAWVP